MSDRKPDYHAINREGHLVTIPGSEPLPAGFTPVAPEDLERVEGELRARFAPAPAPAPALDEHPPLEHAPEGDHKAS